MHLVPIIDKKKKVNLLLSVEVLAGEWMAVEHHRLGSRGSLSHGDPGISAAVEADHSSV
jgi:hypothetical protein